MIGRPGASPRSSGGRTRTESEGLRCGDYIHFVPADGAVAVMADAWLAGEGLPPTVCYAVDVQAEFTCRDGVFTVQAFHLNVLKD